MILLIFINFFFDDGGVNDPGIFGPQEFQDHSFQQALKGAKQMIKPKNNTDEKKQFSNCHRED